MNQIYFLKINPFFFKITCNNQVGIVKEINFISQDHFTPTSAILPKVISLLEIELKKGINGLKTSFPDQYLDFSQLTSNEITVLKELKKVALGKTISYSKLAEKAGFSKKSGRFIGNVMAKNPFPILYPCHRVILNNGKIGNYTGGLEIKKYLLKKENSIFNF